MCGITGFWDTSRQKSALEMQAIAQKMSDALLHRGPDDGGAWVDAVAGIALGHRRLAIVDLSPQGHQPMVSANGRYIIVFNGEIYNFLDLRRELERLGHRFRGSSDTEVMLAAFTEWGLQQAVQQFNGMFAFALWDCQERVLHLCRDRLGEKPLYYGWMGKTLLFGSELKALKAYPHFQAEINRDALALFLRHNYIPTPYSIYQGIYKLPPATVLTWNGGETRSSPIPYWSAKQIAESGVTHPFAGSESEAAEKLEALLQEAVKLRMVADVPLGAFLSGGIDSSTIVAMMQRVSSQPVKTFTIGFYENSYNEAAYAKAVAQHLGTDHTELYVTPEEALAVIPKLPTLYDEPFSDSSQIPTFLVSQLARGQVTVALSGDGGDELFGGYNRYFLVSKIWQQIGWIPSTLRQFAGDALTSLSSDKWNQAFSHVDSLLPAQLKHPNPGDKIHKLAEILAMPNPDAMYRSFVSHWKNPEVLVIGSREPPTVLTDSLRWAHLPSFIQRMMYLDTVSYLPDDILVKVDRASMGVALEARVPLLDHRLVEFALRLPLSMKINNSGGKWLLREILCKYVPRNLIERPKMGFGVPIDRWLRGSLRDWAEELLCSDRLQQEGFFNAQPIRQKWKEHLEGDDSDGLRQRNWQYYLWDVLMFQAWLDESKKPA
ncbi:asparagine synthase (glutamine-hydrolyzing) [Microcoleus sp. FACHB-831]|uniref:asparagine synthase (glutamine-hydrolyzing) n=1 Tax=Microcoleus sp. FACHB-831 TaxID=2692827 RepID=UPI001688C9E1|nr:asparagine synthase (glutamine-hydrolyzing) [Microcoleus sp. FACHB-831]MBD1920397.1 asparagine synthase (glutamine-hydrolyzing) [Microcoleus sp. FACHB-831]